MRTGPSYHERRLFTAQRRPRRRIASAPGSYKNHGREGAEGHSWLAAPLPLHPILLGLSSTSFAMARTSEKTPLVKKEAEKLPFPLGLVSPGVRPYLELIRFHKV